MSKLKKFFSRDIGYHAAKYVFKVSHNYIQKYDERKLSVTEKRWQRKFKGKKKFLFDFDSGLKIFLYNDSVLSKLIYEGFEFQEMQLLKSGLKEGDIFIDIGANIGMYALLASRLVGQSGCVLAFEPTPEIYGRLVENLKINEIKNVRTEKIGISDKEGSLGFQISDNGFDAWNTFAKSENDKFQKSIEVRTEPLDLVLSEAEKAKIKFVKIDVEGWEKFVLLGGEKFFRAYSPVVMVEFAELNTFAAGYPVHEIYDIMVDYGYAWFRYKDGRLMPEARKFNYSYDNLVAQKIK